MNMELFNVEENQIYIGNINMLSEWSGSDSHEKIIERVKQILKNYLELDNVSFLFASGASVHLGGVTIRYFPIEIENYIKEKNIGDNNGIYEEFLKVIEKLQHEEIHHIKDWEIKEDTEKFKRIKTTNDIACEFENVLNFLIAKDYLLDADKSCKSNDILKRLIKVIKEGLFSVCNIENRQVPQWLINKKKASQYTHQNEQALLLENESKYIFHEKFLKSLLQRPLNLKRANIFTTNYDLAFEYAFDGLGVHYIDGFAGFHHRCFKPETFQYDIFYPGSTTAGKVNRIEKVLRYFKLHGSVSWVMSENRDAINLYGIEEMSLDLIEKMDKKGEIIVYPTAVKKSYTLDFPYSELLRQFAATITMSQSVLVTVGYSFADEHINDIIFQALTFPSFTLIIVDLNGTKDNPYIERIKNLNDPRIIILQGSFFGDFLTFTDKVMPNFYDMNINVKVATTLNQYFEKQNNNKNDE